MNQLWWPIWSTNMHHRPGYSSFKEYKKKSHGTFKKQGHFQWYPDRQASHIDLKSLYRDIDISVTINKKKEHRRKCTANSLWLKSNLCLTPTKICSNKKQQNKMK